MVFVKKKKGGLGRGLDELQAVETAVPLSLAETHDATAGAAREIPLKAVSPNPFQPRESADSETIAELAESVRRHGVVEPILVRPLNKGRYQLVAGHRRLLAAQRAGLKMIPAVVRRLSDEESLVLSLVENLQREDLSPLEEANAFARLAEGFGFTHRQIGEVVGRSRTYVTNSLRLLNLSETAQQALQKGTLSRGQALAIMALPEADREHAIARALNEGLSVRQLEALAKKHQATATSPSAGRTTLRVADPYIEAVVSQLEAYMGTRVRISTKQEGGRIEISFYSTEDLNRLLKLILPSEHPY